MLHFHLIFTLVNHSTESKLIMPHIYCMHFPCISATYAMVWCACVHPFIRFMYCMEMSKHIVKYFHLLVAPPLVFLYYDKIMI